MSAGGDTKMRLSQYQLSFTRSPNRTVHIICKLSGVPLKNAIVHWYQEKEGEPLKRIFYRSSKNYKNEKPNSRLETDKKDDGIFYLIINNVAQSDEATYYCACWDLTIFGDGTKLTVTPPGKTPAGDIFPKPTIFLPSIAETNLHKAGTHLCLLENFFPDVIKVYWKEKNGNTILESQQGNTMKTNNTMQGALDLSCHTEQVKLAEQLFSEALGQQLTGTSVYYTYLLLLLNSVVYFAFAAFCLFRRTASERAQRSPESPCESIRYIQVYV
ncbi:uncharacterized protein LOC134390937 [Cynocephalus volans]|uniref:uncharacterized protein LOC134390937 n=1 Tax=Cynocephalus volans TaxID=110931 RepID=UPI002FCA202E